MFSPTDDECTELIRTYYRAVREAAVVAEKEFENNVQAAVATLAGFQALLVVRLATIESSNQADAIERIQGLAKDVRFLVGPTPDRRAPFEPVHVDWFGKEGKP